MEVPGQEPDEISLREERAQQYAQSHNEAFEKIHCLLVAEAEEGAVVLGRSICHLKFRNRTASDSTFWDREN